MTLGSICDGIGGWQLAAVRAGIKPVWSSEIDSFCQYITRRHFPETVQLGDLNQISDAPKVDIITAGTPCQNLSIAGNRSGINGEKSSLFFKSVIETILGEHVPMPKRWLNAGVVDGSNVHICWRTLDAQHFGTAQRRRRIFLVADFTARRAAKILFEPASLSGHSTTRTKSQCQSSAGIAFGIGRDAFNQGINAKFKPTIEHDLQPPLTARGAAAVATNIVRRLTPVECERLQGLPDNFTEGGSDTRRYKALGNGIAQPCADFILQRIKEFTS